MSFGAITDRANGANIPASWFNTLRDAGVALENFLGGGFVAETSFTIANIQVAPANVTGLVFNSASYKGAQVFVEVRRRTGTNESVSIGRLLLFYRENTAAWDLVDELGGDDDGVTFTITAGGQVQYISDNMSGSGYVGTMKFKAITFSP
jgi:hypothetical protein